MTFCKYLIGRSAKLGARQLSRLKPVIHLPEAKALSLVGTFPGWYFPLLVLSLAGTFPGWYFPWLILSPVGSTNASKIAPALVMGLMM